MLFPAHFIPPWPWLLTFRPQIVTRENESNTLQDTVLTVFRDADTDARIRTNRTKTVAVCLQPHYVGRRHKKLLRESTYSMIYTECSLVDSGRIDPFRVQNFQILSHEYLVVWPVSYNISSFYKIIVRLEAQSWFWEIVMEVNPAVVKSTKRAAPKSERSAPNNSGAYTGLLRKYYK